jgi:ATP-dependent helicase HrpB
LNIQLPIDDVLAELVAAVKARGVAVLVAPPGAGKTTRVPSALLDAGLCGDGDIVVLQPRRLAARLAAARVAFERGVVLGQEVGYEIRLDRKVSGATRIRFVTEGILTARLIGDPMLRGTSCVIIDEFHERHLDGDVALAMLVRLRATRQDLKIVVMSATLDAEPVAAFLQAPVVTSLGRAFPVAISHADAHDDLSLPIGKQVSGAVRKLLRDKLDGDILVFLPGAAEIRYCTEDLAAVAQQHDLLVVPLHGDLTVEEQNKAIVRAPQRKVILATNVAETSVTIDGVVAVIDSGRARVARHSPWSGLPMLQVEPISKASAAQRAGRAGRTRPGVVLRLYTQHDHDGRRPFDAAEIARADLAGVALDLRGGAAARLDDIRWFEAPPVHAVHAAESLLLRLGAVDDAGALTAMGRRMQRFATHPRLARLICEAEGRSVGAEACLIAALASARELRVEKRSGRSGRGARMTSPSDLIDDLDAMLDARAGGMKSDRIRSAGLDVSTAHTVHKVAEQLQRQLQRSSGQPRISDDDMDQALQISILAGYPDRVAKRRAPRSADFVFASGGGAALAPNSNVIDAQFIVAVDTAETGERGAASKSAIRRASAIDPSWLIDLFLDRIVERDELAWNSDKQRVERVTQMMYDAISIDESRDAERARTLDDGAPAAALLAKQAIAAGIDRFVDGEALAQWRARLATVARAINDDSLLPTDEQLQRIVAGACQGLISFEELRRADVMSLLDASLADKRQLIAKLAPGHIDLPRRKRVAIHYELNQSPWIAARMQDFFGLAKGPAVCDGRVPLVLHLLAPNQRPVQVTQDLPGFWVKHYPALRNQLMRKYPRHQWPPDPTVFLAGE